MVQGYYQQSVIDPGEYNGGIDDKGWRFGVGTCRWNNGDVYEGEWKDNLRHGNGKYTEEGFTYEGQWQLDLKHGRGKMVCKNGDIFTGTWMHDRLNGVCGHQSK